MPGHELGIDSDGFFDLDKQPERVAVVGTGYIGIELAGIFNALGSHVTIFSRSNEILRRFDDVIRDNLRDEMEKSGIQFCYNSQVTGLSRSSDAIKVHYKTRDKEESTVEADCVLWAVGRAGNLKDLNLAAAGVKTNDKGYVSVDGYQNTSTPGVYGVGDCCGIFQLTPGKKTREKFWTFVFY